MTPSPVTSQASTQSANQNRGPATPQTPGSHGSQKGTSDRPQHPSTLPQAPGAGNTDTTVPDMESDNLPTGEWLWRRNRWSGRRFRCKLFVCVVIYRKAMRYVAYPLSVIRWNQNDLAIWLCFSLISLEVILHQNEGDTGRFDTNSSSETAQQFETLNF